MASFTEFTELETNFARDLAEEVLVDVMLEDLDKDDLMEVMKFINEKKFKHTFKCGRREHPDDEDIIQNLYNLDIITIHEVNTKSTLPLYMKPFVKHLIYGLDYAKQESNEYGEQYIRYMDYEDINDPEENENCFLQRINSKAKTMKYGNFEK